MWFSGDIAKMQLNSIARLIIARLSRSFAAFVVAEGSQKRPSDPIPFDTNVVLIIIV
jgi:hypothetical protein